MLYPILKLLMALALKVFFRRIEVRNQHLAPSTGPLVVVSNHPNTLMDPLLVAVHLRQEIFFLAKGSLFGSPFRTWLLHKLHMIPVYRKQDQETGKTTASETAKGNQSTFARCFEFLRSRGTLLIFPEGTSILERRLREIKTGAARIALGALGPDTPEVLILPMGLHYSDATRFRSEVLVQFGPPIKASDYLGQYLQNPSQAVQALTAAIRQRMEELVLITADNEQDSLAAQIEVLYRQELMQDLGLKTTDRQQRFELSKGIVNAIAYFREHEPLRVQQLHLRLQQYLGALQKLGLHDRHLQRTTQVEKPSRFRLFAEVLLLLLCLPLYLYGLLHNYLPYRLPGLAAGRLTSEREYEAPIMMVTGMFTFPFWYALLLVVFWQFVPSLPWLLLYLLSLPVSGFFAMLFYRWLRSYSGRWRLLSLFRGRSYLLSQLRHERAEIIAELENARGMMEGKSE